MKSRSEAACTVEVVVTNRFSPSAAVSCQKLPVLQLFAVVAVCGIKIQASERQAESETLPTKPADKYVHVR